jgi:hypothetical protein
VNHNGFGTVEANTVGTRAVKHYLFYSVTVKVTNNIAFRKIGGEDTETN